MNIKSFLSFWFLYNYDNLDSSLAGQRWDRNKFFLLKLKSHGVHVYVNIFQERKCLI